MTETASATPKEENTPNSLKETKLADLLQHLIELRSDMVEFASERLREYSPYFSDEKFTASAWNLALYLAMRRHDVRDLQMQLANAGLSSLGNAEAHILQMVNNLIHLLSLSVNTQTPPMPEGIPTLDYHEGMLRLSSNTDAIFGQLSSKRAVRIMVTLPSHAAQDYELVKNLLAAGMNCARINCAHDSEADWEAMIKHVKQAETELDKHCKIHMDLAGHKIRTGPLALSEKGKTKNAIKVNAGEKMVLSRSAKKCTEAESKKDKTEEKKPVTLACTCKEVFNFLSPGETVWIDDGKIGSLIESVSDGEAVLRVTHVGPKGGRIKADKGLNFPETTLKLPALSDKDLNDLNFVAQHADLVGFSFVQSLDDMSFLIEELKKRGADQLPIIAKIETRRAVKKLPSMLLGTIGRHPMGVMIARGDLAVELGGERMAEVQEELLWICEAAHVPVIWATQVLESLAKKGLASRPELTDAAMGERAECVMLNKGPYIIEAVRTLADILSRMKAHQHKKRSQLRGLSWWA